MVLLGPKKKKKNHHICFLIKLMPHGPRWSEYNAMWFSRWLFLLTKYKIPVLTLYIIQITVLYPSGLVYHVAFVRVRKEIRGSIWTFPYSTPNHSPKIPSERALPYVELWQTVFGNRIHIVGPLSTSSAVDCPVLVQYLSRLYTKFWTFGG